ncbi:MAG: hypothetical protein B6U68_00775 [Candidatus Aenigmarchaeota archaeon ex4484_14]|nr:MAG: hypothetical protein B6U68_00775 [Candidatus Aenigmarchaeota archaeon ex4484_14]
MGQEGETEDYRKTTVVNLPFAEEKEKSLPTDKNEVEVNDWLREQGWSSNPFTLSINPEFFVGYDEQCKKILRNIEEKHKLALIIGPTGSGKTTFLKWIEKKISAEKEFIPLFISKPPDTPEELALIFKEKFKPSFLERLLFFIYPIPHIKTPHHIPEFVNKRLGDRYLLVLCDEVHESDMDVLEWLRVLSDQINNIIIILSGLPIFDEILAMKLQSFQKRIITRVELVSLSEKNMKELIRKRIETVGGKYPSPFTEDTLEKIYEKTGGFPREVIRVCDRLVNYAIENHTHIITPDFLDNLEKSKEEKKVSLNLLDNLPYRQREIIELLIKRDMRPRDIVNSIDLSKYKSRQHALRSVNNILQRLMKDGVVERRTRGRSFVYTLSTRAKTILVKA